MEFKTLVFYFLAAILVLVAYLAVSRIDLETSRRI